MSDPTLINQRGMTLIEVLVALAILGLVASGVLVMTGQSARFIASSEEKMLAQIVADNVMVEAMAQVRPLNEGEETIELALAGRDWQVLRKVTDTGLEGVIRIDLSVSRKDERQQLARATTLKALRP